jgi:hypothetical protein
MMIMRSLLSGLRALLHKDEQSLDMDEKLRAYLEVAAQNKMRAGMSEKDALRAARVEMGSTETVKQKIRTSRWESTAEGLAGHALRRAPAGQIGSEWRLVPVESM